jgi:hypothetical protein
MDCQWVDAEKRMTGKLPGELTCPARMGTLDCLFVAQFITLGIS